MKKIVAAAMALPLLAGCSMVNQREVVATVKDKDRVCSGASNGSSSCKYLIFTDKGTFQNTDSMVQGKFNSSDVYGNLDRSRSHLSTQGCWIPSGIFLNVSEHYQD